MSCYVQADENILSNIGEFDVVLYFMKAQTNERDREAFFCTKILVLHLEKLGLINSVE